MGALALAFAGSGPAALAETLADAVALYKQKRYAEAKAILGPLVASEPSNAAAHYYLGMAVFRAGGPSALDSARTQLAKAAELAPKNAGYLAEYAGVCLLMADRNRSFGLALEGRNAMARAVAEDPSDLDAREGLMEFHAKAPWPLGNADKALKLAGEIAKRDPKRGLADYRKIEAIFNGNGQRAQAQAASQAAQRLAQGRPE